MADNREPLRVLQINSGNKNFGGVSSFLYNVYSHIDRERVQFDFLCPYRSTYDLHRDDIEALGGRIYELRISMNKLAKKWKLYPEIKGFLKRHPYQIVHVNSGNFFFNLIVSKAVRDAGIENIVVHSHNTEDPRDSAVKRAVIRLLKPALEERLTARCACSEAAARFMFMGRVLAENGVKIVRNGIVVRRFEYDARARGEARRRLGLEGKRVIGHVGRLVPQKNQTYLVKVFARLAAKDDGAVLVMVGGGEDMERLRDLAKSLNVADRVLFLGARTDIERYYQAFDAFAFPSLWEGLGMVLVEAQIAGLNCVASTAVPAEADITGNVTFLDLGEENMDRWVDAIQVALRCERRSRFREAIEAGYDIDSVAADLTEWYLSMADHR